MTRGLEMIASAAEKVDLQLGSRAVDLFRGIVRLSFEKEVQSGSRSQFRAPTFEFSREFVEDLPAQKEYQTAVADFLQSLSLRLAQAKPQQFVTLSGVAVDLEIHWPFRAVQSSDDQFIHVLARVGAPWSWEANFTVAFSGIEHHQMGIYSLSPPTVERFIVNAIRMGIDRRDVRFYRVGQHPSDLQSVRISASFFDRPAPTDTEVSDFLLKKVYWLGFRESEESSRVPIADPYDCSYMGQSAQRLRQLARVLSANEKLSLEQTLQFASPTDKLLLESGRFESEFAAVVEGRQPEASRGEDLTRQDISRKAQPSVFVSYSSEDAPFAESLARALADRNVGVWLDRWELRIGDSLTKRIGQALHKNDFIVVVLSPASVRSEWVRHELAEAMLREIRQKRVIVLPVIARPCRIPPFLTDKKYADFTRDPDSALKSLVEAIGRHHESSSR